MDRITLNGYIERLIDSDGHDAEARAAVLAFALEMKESSPVQMNALIEKPGSSFTGQTPEHGNVKVDDDKKETKEYSAGSVLERVGYYKIWRQKEWVHISHFWKAEVTTESETEQTQQWVLAYHKTTLEAEWFGERGIKHLYTLKLTRMLNIDFNREMFEERWGPSLKRQHRGALQIAVAVST